ncbi:MAG: ComF family protein [Coriobacteriia bacterium]|nr:ComF family protein [Coriobacteriia bacterium]
MRALLDFVFPPRCAGCDRPGVLLCDACRVRIERIDPALACPRCGAPGVVGLRVDLAPCAECRGRTFAFSEARCAALLEPPVSRAVVELKDGGERRYASLFAELLAAASPGWLEPTDVLVPAPASPAALRRRGFDHAADIARALGRITGNEVRLLLRASAGADQRELGREARFANRAAAFRMAAPKGLAAVRELPARVVLVDDVLTTGATLDAAARVLRQTGVSEVRALAVTRAVGCSRALDREAG